MINSKLLSFETVNLARIVYLEESFSRKKGVVFVCTNVSVLCSCLSMSQYLSNTGIFRKEGCLSFQNFVIILEYINVNSNQIQFKNNLWLKSFIKVHKSQIQQLNNFTTLLQLEKYKYIRGTYFMEK
jgi:hypothetical protein